MYRIGVLLLRHDRCPVTARLSKLCYDHFGDEVADELVNWLNSVDAGRRDELRELNELNFARFDASVRQQFAEANARLEKRFAEQDLKFEKRFAALDAKIDVSVAHAETKLERGLKEHTRWMFVVWTSLLIPIIGLWMRP